jgi:hypothetical protein
MLAQGAGKQGISHLGKQGGECLHDSYEYRTSREVRISQTAGHYKFQEAGWPIGAN